MRWRIAKRGLKKDIDLSFLKGREVGQIAIGLYQVQFGFDEDVRISVEAEFRYFDGREEWNWKPEPGKAQVAARTVGLLGRTVEKVEWKEDGTLTLGFSDGQRLTVLDSSEEFESYDVTRPGRKIIV
jgi:Family of unknown function (DUF6188)